MPLSQKQAWSIKRANKRLNLWDGSVRSGKTVGTIYAFLKYIPTAPPGDLLLAGKTIDALKRNVIGPIQDLVGEQATYHPGLREMRIFGRTLYTVGASDERSEGKIRGATIAGGYGDELTLWPESFFNMTLSRMSVKGAQFFGTTNPDNPNHWLKKKFIDRREYLDMARFHFKIDDNPFLPKEYVESLKREYVGLWYKRFIEGLWCVAEGAIFDFFDESKHVLQSYPEAKYYIVGIDYGTTNPCVFLLFGINPSTKPKIWVEREYYYDPIKRNRQQTDVEFSKDFKDFILPVANKVRDIYCDPSAESFQLQLRRDGVTGIIDANNDVLNGIRTVARMLQNGEFGIYKTCRNYISEMYSYAWNPKRQLVGEDVPLKVNDHAQDCGRYVIHTKYGDPENYYDISAFAN
jgi:PBSX family phage terminase large subunit